MRRIGQVLHISPSNRAVVKAEKVPKIGETVMDEKKKTVGTVSDILGSTVSPYVAVELKVKDPQNIVNSFLYVSPSSKHKMRSRRK